MAKEENNNKNWYIFDADEAILGRLATGVANVLRGKSKVTFRNHLDEGDYAVVINASKIKVTGNKEEAKLYHHHTGYLGHLKTSTYKELKEKNPEEIIRHAVSGMLPKNKLRDDFMKRLKVYPDAKHPHVNVKFKNEN